MTYRSKYRQNKKLIQAFAEFLDECTTIEQKIKISGEIGRLQAQNESIKRMPMEETEKEIIDYEIKVTVLL